MKKTEIQLEETVERLKILDEVAKSINSPSELTTIYETINKGAKRLISYNTFCILLLDDKKEEFKAAYTQGLGKKILETARFQKGDGYAGWVLREKKELIVRDAKKDAPIPIKYKELTSAGLRSFFVVPLRIETKIVGCFIIASKEIDKYSKSQIGIINSFACWAAIAINKHELISKKEKLFEKKEDILENYLPHTLMSPFDLFKHETSSIVRPEHEPLYNYMNGLYTEMLTNAKIYLLFDEYERIEPLLTKVWLIQILNDVINDFSKGYAKLEKIEFEIQIIPTQVYVWADYDKLKMVFVNLISNAIKFGPNGGKIIVRLKKENKSLFIEIVDEGRGINEDDKKIEPRKRGVNTNKIVGGGLGLYVSNQIILAHKWKPLKIENNKSKGCTVSFEIPEPEKCPYEILVIDDDDAWRKTVREYLKESNFLVCTFASITEAEKNITDRESEKRNKIKLVIIDIMNNRAGIRAAKYWESKYGYKTILISERTYIRGIDYIKKPFDKDRLLTAVDKKLP